jgi:hypothetical protein
MKAIASSSPVNAIMKAKGITEITNSRGPAVTDFQVNVEKIFNKNNMKII